MALCMKTYLSVIYSSYKSETDVALLTSFGNSGCWLGIGNCLCAQCTALAAPTNCLPFLGVNSMLCLALSKGISFVLLLLKASSVTMLVAKPLHLRILLHELCEILAPSHAKKYHPDVNKELGADEVFKSIHLAYDILIDEKKRNQYDWTLRHQENAGTSSGDNWAFNHEYDDGQRIYRWAYLRRKMQREKYWEQYHTEDDEVYDESEEENTAEERGSFVEVLRSAFLSLFLMQTVGTHLSLTFSSLMALLDRKLDTGYKVGYVFAWLLGGRSGILLTVFLSFASWVCGKTSSSIVAVVLVAMWFGSNLARYAPLPQGALLTLLYMSIKLQVDLN
ncbi:uncharacterized protein LOC111380222 [Olea europaea var. sylvestris]|uniref:uncharacterized protein LOC111380222 n=1 Tax=Olea europaea var. sylvestris TaxID=158386 RepID=UPI000C1D5754|nr:uncharacterized protein LOC111380222 [Olea europaea var. sylvestris]